MDIQFCNKCVILIQLVHVKFHLKQCIRIFRFYFKFHTFLQLQMASTNVATRSQVYLVSCAEGTKGSKLPFTEAAFWSFLAPPLCSESGYPNSSSKPYH